MMFKQIAKIALKAQFFKKVQMLWIKNQKNFHLYLSKREKLFVGIYLIIKDYAEGIFPPTFDDQKKAYDAEINYRFSLPGVSVQEFTDGAMRKPFWFGNTGRGYLKDFIFLSSILDELGIHPPQRLLELGCGTGWMSEFLAMMGFQVLGTSISPDDIEDAKARIKSLEVKKMQVDLNYLTTPMESVSDAIESMELFDAVFVFEALHHAYDWRQTIVSSYKCLKPGGWLIICNEPNVVHTYVSYRVAKLSNTHEIGFKRSELISHLKVTDFGKVRILKNLNDYFIKPHWIAAEKQ